MKRVHYWQSSVDQWTVIEMVSDDGCAYFIEFSPAWSDADHCCAHMLTTIDGDVAGV